MATGEPGDNARIPSGYTYPGQFVDHDITFDPTSQLDRRNDPAGLLNFRTPRFDLDSVYGSGPLDDPFAYTSDGLKFILNGFDMPRVGNLAVIGDPRNDENGIVSQLHVAFMPLHNACVDLVVAQAGGATAPDTFENAQRLAQWHYQWVVAHDFLRRIIGDELHAKLLVPVTTAEDRRETVHLRNYRHKKNAYLPVEFSVAAYRYGHAQVRDRYSINGQFNVRLFDRAGNDLRGFLPLRGGWQASWPFFFEMDATPPQLSHKISPMLSPALRQLQGAAGDMANLAFRNLKRGAAIGLPSGQAVAAATGEGVLSDGDLTPCPPGRAPLWFYMLREAQVTAVGEHLGPVGGRIVGETLLGLLRADQQSYLTVDPTWLPTLPVRGTDPASFDMVDLLRFAVPDQAVRF
ncbi:MAG: myeloperoxidase thyroid peroxidase cyclooxygenase catalytic subunit [Frankiales bacterium]|nr:myeloperoxidase thyroid peroxidase cyclooxygenase catalytic subunit [Frankiales bacterium]